MSNSSDTIVRENGEVGTMGRRLVANCYSIYQYLIQVAKKRFLFGPLFFNITNVFCAKTWVGHACICPRMVTG